MLISFLKFLKFLNTLIRQKETEPLKKEDSVVDDKKVFKDALELILKYEGGYVNHPDDPGGATNKGVTQNVYNKYRSSLGQPENDVKEITDNEVEEIYFERYWLTGKCNELPIKLAIVHFDTSVNTGIFQASKFLQRSINVLDDGIIGPKTLEALKGFEEVDVIESYIEKRIEFYKNLVERKPQLKVFLKGWLNRVEHLKQHIESIN